MLGCGFGWRTDREGRKSHVQVPTTVLLCFPIRLETTVSKNREQKPPKPWDKMSFLL